MGLRPLGILGVFTKIEGRGKSPKQPADENKTIHTKRGGFMHRTNQRQGAAPPWVEIQRDLTSHIRTF